MGPRQVLGLAEDHAARSLSSVSPGNLGHGVGWPHEVQTSNLSPSNQCNTGPLATHGERPAERSPWTASVCLCCLKLAKRCQELKESWQAPQLSLPRSKFPRGRRIHLHGEQEKEGLWNKEEEEKRHQWEMGPGPLQERELC